MSTLIIFCRSPNRDLYINVICRVLLDNKIEKVIFCWIDTSQKEQDAIDRKIHDFFQGDTFEQNREVYKAAYQLRRNLQFVNMSSDNIDEFIRNSIAENPIYDVSGLTKEDLIMVVTSLLANDAKRVRFLRQRERSPKIFHQYGNVRDDLGLVDVYDLANKYALFLENKEGHTIGVALMWSLIVSAVAFGTTRFAAGLSTPSYIIDLFNFIGGTFPVTFAAFIVAGKYLDKRRRARSRSAHI